MRFVGLSEMQAVFDRDSILSAVRQSLIDHAAGWVQSPPPGVLTFRSPPGDCHVKIGHRLHGPVFVVKVATGFYDNPRRGLPVNHGALLVLDAQTGQPLAWLHDEGWLTAWRTVAATVLATLAVAPAHACRVGVVGSGQQAALTLEWLRGLRPQWERTVWGRDWHKSSTLAEAHDGRPVTDLGTLLREVDVVITTTPAQSPLFQASEARPGQTFVAVGADSPGKRELPGGLFANDASIWVDDIGQALDHGDWGAAVREGRCSAQTARLLGDLLADRTPLSAEETAFRVVDLTGLAAQDLAMAQWCLQRIGPAS